MPTEIWTALIGIVSGGALLKIFDAWRGWKTDDRDFIRDTYRKMIEDLTEERNDLRDVLQETHETVTDLQIRLAKLQQYRDGMKGRIGDLIAENVKLKAKPHGEI